MLGQQKSLCSVCAKACGLPRFPVEPEEVAALLAGAAPAVPSAVHPPAVLGILSILSPARPAGMSPLEMLPWLLVRLPGVFCLVGSHTRELS